MILDCYIEILVCCIIARELEVAEDDIAVCYLLLTLSLQHSTLIKRSLLTRDNTLPRCFTAYSLLRSFFHLT